MAGPISLISTFGFHFNGNQIQYQNARHKNITNIIGYIPIIGIIAGLYRMIMNYHFLQSAWPVLSVANAGNWPYDEFLSRKSFHAAEFSRGVLEGVSLGFLFIVPDIIFTIGRSFCGWR